MSVWAGAGMTTALHAQQAQYCAQFSDGTSPDCSFATLQQCNASVSGVGGECDLNPAATYQAPPPAAQSPLPFDPMAVPPPPPMAGQPSAPLPLPDASPYQE